MLTTVSHLTTLFPTLPLYENTHKRKAHIDLNPLRPHHITTDLTPYPVLCINEHETKIGENPSTI